MFIFSPPGREGPFRIVHAVPGRARLRLPPIRLRWDVEQIETALHDLSGIRSVRVNPHASCVVVTHATDVTANEICQHLRRCLRDRFAVLELVRPKSVPSAESNDSPEQRSLYAESLEGKMWRVGTASAVLPFFVFRRGMRRRGLVGRFLTIPGLASLALSLHILKSGVDVLFKTGRPNADTLTATGIVSSLVAGQDASALAIVWLTGDARQHADYVAKRIGLNEFICDMQPNDKLHTVRGLRERGAIVVMVGDGSNDAPALAAADVGIVLGANRTDVAVEAADIIIAGGNPSRLPELLRLGRDTMRVIRENFAIAIGVNSVGLALGALGWLPLFWGVVLHNCSTLVVVLNSSRLLYHDLGAASRDV